MSGVRLAVYPPRSMIEESDSRAAEVVVDSVRVAERVRLYLAPTIDKELQNKEEACAIIDNH